MDNNFENGKETESHRKSNGKDHGRSYKKGQDQNEDIRKKTNARDLIQEIKTKKWRWADHLARRHDKRLTHCIAEWTQRTHTRRRRARGGRYHRVSNRHMDETRTGKIEMEQ